MTNPRMYPRTLGLLTCAYGVYTFIRPATLPRVAELEPGATEPSPSGRALSHTVGVRDALSGLSMMLAPGGAPLQAAVAARVAFDLGDVLAFGLSVPPSARPKLLAAAGGWALLCASSLRAAGRRG